MKKNSKKTYIAPAAYIIKLQQNVCLPDVSSPPVENTDNENYDYDDGW